jgi:fumarylacetoacetase
VEHHPYGAYRKVDGGEPRLCARVGDHLLDLPDAAGQRDFAYRDVLSAVDLNPLMAAGREVWGEVGVEVRRWAAEAHDELIAISEVELVLPFAVADYVDFYASEHHARNLARILRPGQPELQPNWTHQPVGYHGRAGTVVVSGTPVRRPTGNTDVDGEVARRPTAKLDVEVEVGFVIGSPSTMGEPVSGAALEEHVFGVVLVNDWSARDIQAFETVPLGPFLGKSFQTSVSAWVTPLSQLTVADIVLELEVNGEVISCPPYSAMHWSPAQMLAHLTSNGASLRTGDLFASGTVSGPQPDQVGSLIEAWQNRRFLQDGDEVVIRGRAGELDLGEVRGVVRPAR